MPQRGWETVTIPGAVSGWVALSERYGKLAFEDLFEPAIRYAHDGYAVSPVVAEKWRLAAPLMPQGLGWQEHFLLAGRTPAAGERFASPAMAATLERIAATRGEAFYRGALADAMVKHANDTWRRARARRLRAARRRLGDAARRSIIAMSPSHEIPPNGQGIAALMALGMLQSFDIGALPADSVAEPAPADRSDEARVRRRASICERCRDDDRRRRRHCSTRHICANARD